MFSRSLSFALTALGVATTASASGIWQRGGTYPTSPAMVYDFKDVGILCRAAVFTSSNKKI